ncbi:MAG: class I SAM-dependent methyltransferase [Candidatus Heimdallarchaeota archaeon]
MKTHWNEVYNSKETTNLGWYEETPVKCLELLEKSKIRHSDLIVDVGCGTASFIMNLLDQGYTNLIGLDISDVAINKVKKHMGEKAGRVHWIVDDITRPERITEFKDIALWHDRAVLHFLQTKNERQKYLRTLKTVLKIAGYVIIAVFNLEGVRECSGLTTYNYSSETLGDFLGSSFLLKDSFNFTYKTPWGKPRPYVYTLFQRFD